VCADLRYVQECCGAFVTRLLVTATYKGSDYNGHAVGQLVQINIRIRQYIWSGSPFSLWFYMTFWRGRMFRSVSDDHGGRRCGVGGGAAWEEVLSSPEPEWSILSTNSIAVVPSGPARHKNMITLI
jgi:hypothetical protein